MGLPGVIFHTNIGYKVIKEPEKYWYLKSNIASDEFLCQNLAVFSVLGCL